MSDTCGCCAGTEVVVPVSEVNPPGQSALAYRAGTYATFFETMLARLTRVPGLTTRDPADPSIALLDAWAVVADVLTFYQERIANEGYLPTARERRSVLELAKLIGYRLRPGVAASVRLAFTVANGFAGTLPAGTRAQSVPGTGQSPQFFETSAALDARDAWNALAPRLTRPHVITPAPGVPADLADNGTARAKDVTPTAVDVIDTVYLDGITTGLKPGNALLFVFGSGAGDQYVRMAQAVDAQGAKVRTEVTLVPDPRYRHELVLEILLAQAEYLFAGSDIAAHAVAVLTVLLGNLEQHLAPAVGVPLLRAALPSIALQRNLADARGFTRVSAYLGQLVRALQALIVEESAGGVSTMFGGNKNGATLTAMPAEPTGSPLARLDAIVGALSVAPSIQPANALQLGRSVEQSFAPSSDVAPRLIAALKPAAAGALYAAWSAVATPASRLQVFAARVKATLFASNYAGAATITHTLSKPNSGTNTDTTKTEFAEQPKINTTWKGLSLTLPLRTIALDAPYDHVVAGSWVAIDRPVLDAADHVTGRATTVHIATAVRVSSMDTRTGFSAKVSILSLDPPWLSDVKPDLQPKYLDSESVLRDTVVYAQAEPLALCDEPLDTDVEGGTIDLADLYAGLEPGRWIIVSGNRTDVPGTSGVAAAELAMVAGISQQGSPATQPPLCVPFPFSKPPMAQYCYTTGADVNGDRLVVGKLDAAPLGAKQPEWPLPTVLNQQFCDQVELAPGLYANAYVPSQAERNGHFPSFDGMLVDPDTNVPFPGGFLGEEQGLVVVRVADEKLHTVLTLANALAYSYDRGSVTIFGNVVDATHGQTTGEVLGNGDAARAFSSYALGQAPLTYVSAPTPSGTASTLRVRVNELQWHEVTDLGAAGPAQRAYVTREDDAHKTTVTFGNGVHGARVPTGTANLKATYRYGLGKSGNVDAGQISQLATHPLGAQGVVNPLPATGGADPDTMDQARANAPSAVMALDRLVSVRDYADFARTYAGIGKAVATRVSDGRRQVVHVTVAGSGDIAIDPSSDLYRNLLTSLQTYGDPHQPVDVDVRRVKLIVMSAAVTLLPDYAWESVAPKIRAAVLARFAFDARELGQTAFLSEAVLAVQAVSGVAYADVTVFDGVAENVSAAELAALGRTLKPRPYVVAEAARIEPAAAPGAEPRILAAELVFMTPDIPDTLILNEARA